MEESSNSPLTDALAQVAEPWLPRAEEGLWPQEDRLEDSLEAAGVGAFCRGWGWGLRACC